jgi:hypothetical protein
MTPTNTATPTATTTQTPTNTPTNSATPTETTTNTPNNTPTPTETTTQTPTQTQTQTPTNTPTTTTTSTTTQTPTQTQTQTTTTTTTPTPSPTRPALQAYLFIDRNETAIRLALRNYLVAQGVSPFIGFNISSPSSVQATFNTQMNAYISYDGWGSSEPAIFTSPICLSDCSGVDAYGNVISQNVFQTVMIPSSTVPVTTEQAWYTWMVPTGATPGQKYSTIRNGNSNTLPLDTTMNTLYNSLIVNYTGSTNIPAGVYRVYTTKPGNGSNIVNSGNNWYFRGGTLVSA